MVGWAGAGPCVGFGVGAAGFGCVWRRAHRGSAAARRPTAVRVAGRAAGSSLSVQRQKVLKKKKKKKHDSIVY